MKQSNYGDLLPYDMEIELKKRGVGDANQIGSDFARSRHRFDREVLLLHCGENAQDNLQHARSFRESQTGYVAAQSLRDNIRII